MSITKPVLYIVFNRPPLTEKTFEAIKLSKPPRLYIAADGPRENVETDISNTQKVRRIVNEVDWPCEVFTLFRSKNLGCKNGVITAVNWFFRNEYEGIILEDDCLPHEDFFYFCEWALNEYRHESTVWHINGNNFNAPSNVFCDSQVGFSALAQVWGWATWRDRWEHYQANPYYLSISVNRCWKKWNLPFVPKINKIRHLVSLKNGLDTWDYQWQMTILNKNGFAISCSSNLITNLGCGVNATHTKTDDRLNLNSTSISSPLEFVKPKNSRKITQWYARHMGLTNKKLAIKLLFTTIYIEILYKVRLILAKILYSSTRKIIISSTGRSGSTILYNAIIDGFLNHNFSHIKNQYIRSILIRISSSYINRLSQISCYPFPILKTHDLYHDQYCNDTKCIFVYADPLESARSVDMMVKENGHNWFEEHIYHLGSKGDYKDLYQRDVLNFENILTSWLSSSNPDVLILSYDELWSQEESISKFLGFKVVLPVRKKRKEKKKITFYNKELFTRLSNINN